MLGFRSDAHASNDSFFLKICNFSAVTPGAIFSRWFHAHRNPSFSSPRHFSRLRELFRDLWDVTLSPGSLRRGVRWVADRLAPIRESVRLAWQQAPVVHTDETGMRVMGKLYGFHTVSTNAWTSLSAHPKRGREAIDTMDILPHRDGKTTVHDGLSRHDAYPEKPARGNAHHDRELTAAEESTHPAWVTLLKTLWGEMKEAADTARAAGQTAVDPVLRTGLLERYDVIIQAGLKENPAVLPPPGRRRRPAQTPTRNWLERLDTQRNEVLRFLEDLAVPFDNNLAECDLRMVKVRQKISGTFRTQDGATRLARIRSYLSTARKQGQSMLQVIRSVVTGCPGQPTT